ncbi:MAG: hypothetical protein AAFV33_12835 [Chloroflexota bacterium]
MSIMAQCGMHLPCVEAKLSVFTGIYADVGITSTVNLTRSQPRSLLSMATLNSGRSRR